MKSTLPAGPGRSTSYKNKAAPNIQDNIVDWFQETGAVMLRCPFLFAENLHFRKVQGEV